MSATMILSLMTCLALGLVVGGIYFTAMWRSAELFAAGGRIPLAITLTVGRFSLILAVLAVIATRGGALPLLAVALGIVTARWIVMWRVKAKAS